jgi:hypothetical protein
MSGAAETTIVPHEKLASPNRAVGTQTSAVEDYANRWLAQVMLGQTTGEVRVMVLHRDGRESAGCCVARRCVVGMQIVGNKPRFDSQQLSIEDKISLKLAVSIEMVEIAEMMADKRLVAAAQRKSRFELSTYSQNWARAGKGKRDRRRSEPSRTPDR